MNTTGSSSNSGSIRRTRSSDDSNTTEARKKSKHVEQQQQETTTATDEQQQSPTTTSNVGESLSSSSSSSTSSSQSLRSLLRQSAFDRAARARAAAAASDPAAPSPPAPTIIVTPAEPHTPTNGVVKPQLRLQIGSPNGFGGGAPVNGIDSSMFVESRISTPILCSDPYSYTSTPKDDVNRLAVAASSSSSSSVPPSSGGVACPLCQQSYPPTQIERHAATCDGTSEQQEDERSSRTGGSAAAASSSSSSSSSSRGSIMSSFASQFRISATPPVHPLPSLPRHHDRLTILTWNCWFDDYFMRQRMDAIGSVILYERPHIVALQEVTEASLAMIRRSDWSKLYHITERRSAPYFTLLCTMFPPQDLCRFPFQSSQMARDLLCCNLEVSTSHGLRSLTVGTSHLESEYQRKEIRRQQLEMALNLMAESSQKTHTAVYVGDMNLNGTEGSDIVTNYGWSDGWLQFHTPMSERNANSNGVTLDTKANLMLASQARNVGRRAYQARLDRVWLRFGIGENKTKKNQSNSPSTSTSTPLPPSRPPEWRLSSIERIGMCAIDLSNPREYGRLNHRRQQEPTTDVTTPSSTTSSDAPIVFPSDHFGIITTLEINK